MYLMLLLKALSTFIKCKPQNRFFQQLLKINAVLDIIASVATYLKNGVLNYLLRGRQKTVSKKSSLQKLYHWKTKKAMI